MNSTKQSKNRDISRYYKKKPKVSIRDQINEFLAEEQDETYLMQKVIVIFYIFGVCPRRT